MLRLLLAGTEPARILALTYTKAAAAEMATRVFARLADWVTAGDEALAKALRELLDRAPVGRGDAPRPPAVRAGDRDAGRPQGADHPRLLRAAVAALPPGGRRAARLRDPRRSHPRRAAGRGHRPGPHRGCQGGPRHAARRCPQADHRLRRREQLRRSAGRRAQAPRLAQCAADPGAPGPRRRLALSRVAGGGGAPGCRRRRPAARGGGGAVSPGARPGAGRQPREHRCGAGRSPHQGPARPPARHPGRGLEERRERVRAHECGAGGGRRCGPRRSPRQGLPQERRRAQGVVHDETADRGLSRRRGAVAGRAAALPRPP